MNRNTPQTLSVKRKRGQASVDLLVVKHQSPEVNDDVPEQNAKRTKTDFVYRRIRAPSRIPSQAHTTTRPATQPQRTFHVSRTPNTTPGDIVLIERKAASEEAPPVVTTNTQAEETELTQPQPEQPPAPRKRPGARSTLRPPAAEHSRSATPEPSRDVVKEFEQFASEVEEQESEVKSPSKYKPKAPKLRYKDRHPKAETAGDAMDLDTDYVYDTYVREIRKPGAEGLLPAESVGIIVITEEDEEFWFGEDESDREFDTDEDDENAEGYYANDYPEDEVSSDDEFNRDPYQYHRGEEDDEYDIDDSASEGFGDDADEPRKNPLKPSVGYWGRAGE
ncbi:hypothetical protein BDV96DRAFT_589803 [Lophiotrema nucula]|uniref:Transcription factor Iwr1 domain-containing protein n=1 Tax=Lophiotrema nucula TaxID=690887 RepID=A0A6A5YJD0_9PLEO|nr:hypothetical protein BDV96DRAFT_589803 [Lophiotrema nucula]